MDFASPAPGRLTVEGGSYYADWAVETGNVGYSDAEASALIGAALNDAGGWERGGITFRESGTPKVTFRFVHGPFLCGGTMANGCTTGDATTATVTISYERAAAGFLAALVNHEAGHAFFTATHEGTGSIMTGDSPDGNPTDADIADLEDWLDLPPDDTPTHEGKGGILWFPGDLDTYMTLSLLPTDTEARLTASVLTGVAGTALKGVWGHSRQDLLDGRIEPLTFAVATEGEGFYASEWRPLDESGDLCAGLLVRKATADVDHHDLVIGLAQVQIRSS